MTEEKLTKTILAWLEETGWEIVAFDFPQSGTGIMLHPTIADRAHKNSDTIIPDIIASKNGLAVIFENKNRFVAADFEKVFLAKSSSLFNASLTALLKGIPPEKMFWGIGLPFSTNSLNKASTMLNNIDFVVFVEDDGGKRVIGGQSEIFAHV